MKHKRDLRTLFFGILCLLIGAALLIMALLPNVPLTVRAMYLAGSLLGWAEGIALLNTKQNDTVSHYTVAYCTPRPWMVLLILIFLCLLLGHWFVPSGVPWIWPQPVFITE